MRRFSLLAVVALLVAACTNDSIEELQHPNIGDNSVPESITVGFEENDNETRIQLKNGKTVWTKNDQVSVFYLSDANQKWQYYGETGSRTADLKCVSTGTYVEKLNKVVVVYPYSEDYYINPETCNVRAFMPAEQTYIEDSYGLDGNIMISAGEYNQFSLKNVCGWLKVQLSGNGEKIKSITLRGNNGEQVAGEIYINSADATATLASEMGNIDEEENGAGGNLVFEDTVIKEVTLDCGESVELIPVATSFFIALPPQDFEKGITVEITDDSGYTMTQSTSKLVSIKRNHIQPMAAFEYVNPTTPAAPKPANNEIWYTATEKVEPYWDDANTYGVRLVSNTWDEATGKGVYTFAGDVTKIGADAFLDCKKLKSVVLPDSATEIGSSAFKNCDGLVEVTIGDGVTTIGGYAFYDCDALTTISFGDGLQTIGNYVFYSCNALKEIVLGGNITTLGEKVFYQCSNLTSVVIGDSVTTIGDNTFYDCSKLNSVIIGNGLTEIGSFVFYSCSALKSITIPDGVVTIKSNAFYGCSKLENVTFGENIETIDPYAFRDCKSIKALYGKYVTTDGRALIIDDKLILYAKASGSEYTIPDGVTTIANRAFPDANLSSVTISENVTSIEDYAFSYCSNLKKVYINALIPPTRGNNSFYNNASGRRFYVYDEAVNTYTKLWSSDASNIYGNGSYDGTETTTIYYTTTDENIVNSDYLSIKENTYVDGQGKMVVCGKLDILPGKAFYYCNNLASVTIPECVTTIGAGAFSGCHKLASVTIPDSVTAIENSAFSNCYNLASVTIPASVAAIDDYTFYNCSKLTSVTIPDSVASIGSEAFMYSGLTSVTIPNSVTTIGEQAFFDCHLTSVTIPDSVASIGSRAFCSGSLREFKGKFASADGRCLIIDETIIAYASASGDEYVVPENVTKIGAYTFANSNLRSITLHENINEIKEYAFDNWNLVRIYVMSAEPAYLNGYSFFNTGNYDLKIYVPKDSENRYKFDYYWDDYAAFIYPYDYERVQKNNEIWYASVDNAIVEPYNRNAFGDANFVSNSYQDGRYIITFDRDITEIGYDAFWDCNSLASVTIPDSVTTIGDWAFYSCDSLTSVNIPDSVTEIGEYAFAYCWELSNITLGNSVETIGNDAFNGCRLKSITIPDSVTTIGNGVFSQCWDLAEFKGKYASEDGKCLIMNGILNYFAPFDIKGYTIPNGVTEIGNSAFRDANIENVTIPDSVIKIGSHAFAHCSLNEVFIGNNVSVIDEYAFWNCTLLTSVTVSNSVKSVGKAAFAACYKLQEFKGKFATDDGRSLIMDNTIIAYANASGTTYTIPDSVTEIGDSVFHSCSNLTSVNIPDSVTTIRNGAFHSCSSLTSVNIPDSVTEIGASAFYYCTSLTSVNIPDSVTTIGNQAFDYCTSLTSVYCKAAIPPALGGTYVFGSNGSGRKIYVPVGSGDAYKSANYWSNYSSDIVETTF